MAFLSFLEEINRKKANCWHLRIKKLKRNIAIEQFCLLNW